MPSAIIKKIADSTDMPIDKIETIWNTALQDAEKRKIKNKYAYAVAVLEHVRKNSDKALDSSRYVDDNGYLIAPNSIITGSDVANYLGAEIPGAESLGLDLNKIYRVYRPISQIKDNDFNGKFLLERHVADLDSSTMDKHRPIIIGTVYDCDVVSEQVKGTIALTDVVAIDDLDNGKKYLSAGYWYDPVIESGEFNGMPYDIKMTNIRANHVALVDNPRYKAAVVGDEDKNNLNNNKGVYEMSLKTKFPASYKLLTARLGLDEDTTEQMLSGVNAALDEEGAKKLEEKAEEADKKAADEEVEKEKLEAEKKAADEEVEKMKREKDEGTKGLDSNTIQTLIAQETDKAVKIALDSHNAVTNAKVIAMDKAAETYSKLFGTFNRKAFDSADAVYDEILVNSGVSYDKTASGDYKRGLAEALVSQQRSVKHVAPALDADSISGVSPALQAILKG